MKSLPNIDTQNQEKLYEVVKSLNPELYMIAVALDETGINPIVIPHIIRTLGNLTLGTGHGVVQVYMQAKVIKNIKSEENTKLEEPALLDNF